MSSTPVPSTPVPSTPTPPTSIGSPSSFSVPATPTDDSSSTVSPPAVSPTPAYPTSSTPTSSPSSSPSPLSPTTPRGTGAATTAADPYSTTPTSTPSTHTSTPYSSLVLTESSTRVYETSSTVTSDGVVYTTQITVSTILNPGTVVSSSTEPTKASSSNTGAIVGGVIGGIAVLALLGILGYFLFNKKRRLKDEFDGNFDPLAVSHSKHSPHPSLGGGAAATNSAGRPGNGALPQVRAEEDGRMAGGAGAGPYPFGSPPLPPTHPQMTQYGQGGPPPGAMMALGVAGAAAYNNENSGHHRNPSNISSVSSGNYPNNGPPVGGYFGQPGGAPPHGYQGQPGQYGQYLQGQQYPQGHLQPSLSPTNTISSGGVGPGYANYNNNQPYNNYAPPIGRGPSPGPSVGRSDTVSQSQYTSSSVAGGGGSGGGVGLVGRTQKEIEAFGGNNMSLGGGGMMMGMPIPHVVNPDDGPDGPHQQVPMPEAQPGPVQNYYNPSANPTGPVTSPAAGSSAGVTTVQPTTTSQSKAGLITLAPSPSISSRPPVQHQDAGRVEENPETPSEIPPAYDSLPDEIRR